MPLQSVHIRIHKVHLQLLVDNGLLVELLHSDCQSCISVHTQHFLRPMIQTVQNCHWKQMQFHQKSVKFWKFSWTGI